MSASLPPEWFRRADETPDEAFYAAPRLVTHIDDGAIAEPSRSFTASCFRRAARCST